MNRGVNLYGKKILSLALIFNSLLTIAFAIGLLAGYYTLHSKWTPYPPYIIDGQLFWLLIPCAIMNILPCTEIGKVQTGRLRFHHYVYGLIVATASATLTSIWSSTTNLHLLTIYTTDLTINAGRFFILGGITLVIDDLADVSKRLKSLLSSSRMKAKQNGKKLNTIHFLTGIAELYFFLAIGIYLSQHHAEITLANVVLLGTLFITTATSFANAKRQAWLNIKLETSTAI